MNTVSGRLKAKSSLHFENKVQAAWGNVPFINPASRFLRLPERSHGFQCLDRV